MSETHTTPFSSRVEILGDLWLNYRSDEEFQDFMEYNDLGLPLSYLLSADIVKPTPLAQVFVDETWDLFLGALEVEDNGFESLDEILGLSEG